MTAVRVHILTTEGPATVQGLVVESYDNDVLAELVVELRPMVPLRVLVDRA